MKKKKYSRDLANNSIKLNKKQSIFKNKGFWGLIVIIIMVGSVLSFSAFYSDNGQKQKVKYNDYTFVNNNGGWVTKLNGQDASFYYLPSEVQDINSDFTIRNNEMYYVLKSENLSEYGNEVSRLKTFLNFKNIGVFRGCFSDEDCGDYPVVDCNNGNVITLNIGENNIFTDEKGCINIIGHSEDYMMVVDRFIYNLYGLM